MKKSKISRLSSHSRFLEKLALKQDGTWLTECLRYRYFFTTRNHVLCASQRESVIILFLIRPWVRGKRLSPQKTNLKMTSWRTISVSFYQNRGNVSYCLETFLSYKQKFDSFLRLYVSLKAGRFPKNLLTNLRGFVSFQQCCKDWRERSLSQTLYWYDLQAMG